MLDRNEVHKNNLWHREIAVWILNEKNEILLQRRSILKKSGANKFSLTGGHVETGEEEICAAIRELGEEIGVNVKDKEINFVGKPIIQYALDKIKANYLN